MNQLTIEKISIEVVKVLYKRFKNFPEDALGNRNAPFHTAFLNAFTDKIGNNVSNIPFFITLSSWLHGLNTALGQTFFERVGHILSNGEKREYTSKKLGNILIDQKQKDNINSIITALSTTSCNPNLDEENLRLIIEQISDDVSSMDFSADIFIEDNDSITAIELKSVRPNSGEMRGEKHKILEGKAALKKIFPGKNVKFLIGFPFDPTNPANEPTGFNKQRFLASIINMNKFFHAREVLLGSELWDFLSGESRTMEGILDIINAIANVNFMTDFQTINQSRNSTDKTTYRQKLLNWNLNSEIELFDNDERLQEQIQDNKNLQRIYKQLVFREAADYKISYNKERYMKLKQLI